MLSLKINYQPYDWKKYNIPFCPKSINIYTQPTLTDNVLPIFQKQMLRLTILYIFPKRRNHLPNWASEKWPKVIFTFQYQWNQKIFTDCLIIKCHIVTVSQFLPFSCCLQPIFELFISKNVSNIMLEPQYFHPAG